MNFDLLFPFLITLALTVTTFISNVKDKSEDNYRKKNVISIYILVLTLISIVFSIYINYRTEKEKNVADSLASQRQNKIDSILRTTSDYLTGKGSYCFIDYLPTANDGIPGDSTIANYFISSVGINPIKTVEIKIYDHRYTKIDNNSTNAVPNDRFNLNDLNPNSSTIITGHTLAVSNNEATIMGFEFLSQGQTWDENMIVYYDHREAIWDKLIILSKNNKTFKTIVSNGFKPDSIIRQKYWYDKDH